MLIYHFLCLLVCSFGCLEAAQKDWVIVANGPTIDRCHLQQILENKQVIALDGAANLMQALKMQPNVILGDFDSIIDREYWGIQHTFHEIDEQSMPYLSAKGVWIVPAKDQDYTDLEKGILYCEQQSAQAIWIVNAVGGRMDHTLNNIGLLRKHYRPDRAMSILTENERIEYIREGKTKIQGRIGDACAILGYPEAIITTHGLKYNGQNYPLILGRQESVCNTLLETEAEIQIQGEALVIHPYYFKNTP
jgi:thiamine pyrophosphokinase